MSFTDAMRRSAARAADHLARAQRRPITRITAPRMVDLLAKPDVTDAIEQGMTDLHGDVPRPGSGDAHARGCRCAIVANGFGQGIPGSGGKRYWITKGCPVHDGGEGPSPIDRMAETDWNQT